jgi:hypothetical protein
LGQHAHALAFREISRRAEGQLDDEYARAISSHIEVFASSLQRAALIEIGTASAGREMRAMSWEAVTALSTAFTGIVIAITAIAAVREVRLTAEHTRAAGGQLEQLRKATQFEGALEVFKELDGPVQMEARRFVQFDLAERMKDEQFLSEVGLLGRVDESKHPELTVLRCFERIGFYQAKGFVEKDVLFMVASGRIVTMWNALQATVAIHRSVLGSSTWENFEALDSDTRAYLKSRGLNSAAVEERQRRAAAPR